MKIEKRKVGELIRAEYNPRKITKVEMQDLKDGIDEFSLVLPLVVNEHPGRKNIIIGGHQRLKIWEEMGRTEVDCSIVNLPLDKEKKLNIKLNKNGGSFDNELLQEHFEYEDLIEYGFTPDELFDHEEKTDGLIEDDEIPEVKESKVKRGDIWKLGEHRIMCGDSTSSDDVAKLMNGEKADMVFTDPPYNVSIGTIKHPKFKQREIVNDSMTKDEFNHFCKGWVSCIKLFSDGIIYCWGGQGEDGRIMFSILDEMFHNSTTIIWAKDQFTLGRGKYHCQYEPCWFGWNKNGTTFTDDRTLTNLWNFKRPKKSELHPTMKPIELCENGLKHSSKQGDKVLDLFLGSGSTLIAAEKLKRKCYGMELDEKYCDVIINRWEQFTGLKAEKIN